MLFINKQRKDLLKLNVLYFDYRNTFNYGYMKYNFFKNMIRYISNITDNQEIRYIFNKLYQRKYFKKQKQGKATLYLYNPTNKELPKYNGIVHFF